MHGPHRRIGSCFNTKVKYATEWTCLQLMLCCSGIKLCQHHMFK